MSFPCSADRLNPAPRANMTEASIERRVSEHACLHQAGKVPELPITGKVSGLVATGRG